MFPFFPGFLVNKSTGLTPSINNQRHLEMRGDISDWKNDSWGLLALTARKPGVPDGLQFWKPHAQERPVFPERL